MNEEQFKMRTKRFALDAIRIVEGLPRTRTADIVGRQLLQSATSVGANYRAACRGKSTADVIAKLSIVEEEADESQHWMELLCEAGILAESDLDSVQREANEIVAMTVSSIKTLRTRSSCSNPKSKI